VGFIMEAAMEQIDCGISSIVLTVTWRQVDPVINTFPGNFAWE